MGQKWGGAVSAYPQSAKSSIYYQVLHDDYANSIVTTVYFEEPTYSVV